MAKQIKIEHSDENETTVCIPIGAKSLTPHSPNWENSWIARIVDTPEVPLDYSLELN